MKTTYPGLLPLGLLFTLLLYSCAAQPTPPPEVAPPAKPARVALVLGAGAARGFAHIGVLKVLEGTGVPIHLVVGTSAGSLVGSLYAFGLDAFQIQKIALTVDKGDIADYALPDNGFIKGEKLEEFVNKTVNFTPIEKLKIPFYAVAADIQTGQEVVFARGNVGTAVRSSCSVPGVFRPVKIGDRAYVDGGVVSPVAVDAARRQGADVVIAVNISADVGPRQPEGTIETILQAISIMHSRIAEVQLARADVVIRPRVGTFGAADFGKRHEAIMEGERAALAALPQIRELLDRLKREGRWSG